MSFFGAQTLPGVVSVIDATGLAVQGQLAYGTIGIVGLSAAGDEDSAMLFTSSSEARLTLQGGQMMEALNAAYAGGAKRVYAVRVGAPTAATKDFAGSSGANADAFTLTAQNKGTNGNNIEVRIIQGGSGSGYVTVIVRQYDDYNQYLETFDNDGSGYNDVDLLLAAINSGNANDNASTIVTASVDGSDDLPDLVASYTALASGADGTRSNAEITGGLDLLKNKPCDIIILDDSDSSYHSLASAHCDEASNTIYKSERTCVLGMDQSTTISGYTSQATTLNSRRVVLVAPNVYVPDVGINVSTTTLKDGHVVAGLIAGLKAGQNDPAEPLTFKPVPYLTDVENEYTQGELETLVEGKVLALGLRRNGYRVMKQLTTSSESGWEEWSVVTSIDYVLKDLREYLEELFVGRKGTAAILNLIETAVKGRISLYVEQEILYAFYKDAVQASFLPGDQTFVRVEFTAVPIMPVNNIGIAATVSSVYNFNLALAAQAA